MKIRQVNKNDVDALINVVTSLSRFYLKDKEGLLPEWFANSLSSNEFESRIANDEYQNYVYEVSGILAGYISLKGRSHLFHLFVLPEYQGNGIARMLWEHVKLLSGSPVYTLRSSLFAVPIYKKFGFYVSGDVQEKEGICYQPMELRVESLRQ